MIAPLTTLGHWQREIETWTDMNCVVYAGGAADRELIQVGGGQGQGQDTLALPWKGSCMQRMYCLPRPVPKHTLRSCTHNPSLPLPALQRHDLFFNSTATGGGGRRRGRVIKPNVVLASYETVLKDRGLFSVSKVTQ